MDLSSRKSISIISLCYFLALGYHISLGNNDSSVLRLGAMVAMLVLYVIMVLRGGNVTGLQELGQFLWR